MTTVRFLHSAPSDDLALALAALGAAVVLAPDAITAPSFSAVTFSEGVPVFPPPASPPRLELEP